MHTFSRPPSRSRFIMVAPLALAVGGALSFAPRTAFAQDSRDVVTVESSDSAAMAANRGFRMGIGPALLFPAREGGPYGLGLSVDGRYGIQAGPSVLAPGGMVGGYLQSSRFVGLAMPTFRVTVPVGPFAPYVLGGLGGGWVSDPSAAGIALMGGGGMMVHFGRVIAIGAEASYQTITGTDFGSVVIGPSIQFGGG